MTRYDEFSSLGRGSPLDLMDRDEVLGRADRAGQLAAEHLAGPLEKLLLSDVDSQWTTPLGMVRGLVSFASEVLEAAGVPHVERDSFEVDRFPEDLYRLTPSSLAALGPEVGEMGLVWGASKAIAHRSRHEPAGESSEQQ
jgi:hypothetical protein